MKGMPLNSKALNLLYTALDPNEFTKVSGFESAKEIRDKLGVTYEDTNQGKESKISMLAHSYELLKMKPDENIFTMFTHFTNIIDGLKSLGKVCTSVEIVKNVLRCFSKSW